MFLVRFSEKSKCKKKQMNFHNFKGLEVATEATSSDFLAEFLTNIDIFDPVKRVFGQSDLLKKCSPDSEENFDMSGLVC